jgi:hypothetical protein
MVEIPGEGKCPQNAEPLARNGEGEDIVSTCKESLQEYIAGKLCAGVE